MGNTCVEYCKINHDMLRKYRQFLRQTIYRWIQARRFEAFSCGMGPYRCNRPSLGGLRRHYTFAASLGSLSRRCSRQVPGRGSALQCRWRRLVIISIRRNFSSCVASAITSSMASRHSPTILLRSRLQRQLISRASSQQKRCGVSRAHDEGMALAEHLRWPAPCGPAPPMVAYHTEDTRDGKCVGRLLKGGSGILQVNGYSAYTSMPKNATTLAAMKRSGWPDVERESRKFYDLFVRGINDAPTASITAMTRLRKVEYEIRGRIGAKTRARGRHETSLPALPISLQSANRRGHRKHLLEPHCTFIVERLSQ